MTMKQTILDRIDTKWLNRLPDWCTLPIGKSISPRYSTRTYNIGKDPNHPPTPNTIES